MTYSPDFDHRCNYKTKAGMTYILHSGWKAMGQIKARSQMYVTTKQGQMTYDLQMKRNRHMLDRRLDYKTMAESMHRLEAKRRAAQLQLKSDGRDDILAGGGEGG